jgi:hypothetical protein
MYAIVKNVTNPPRTSRPRVDPRSLILKYASSPEALLVVDLTGVEFTSLTLGPSRAATTDAGGTNLKVSSR